MRGLRLSVAVLALPYAAATALAAVPWGVLLGESRPRWAAVVAGRFAASAVNVVVPTGVVGEPLRLRSVGTPHRARAGEALVWDRAMYLVAAGVFVAACALLAPGGAAFQAAALGATAAYGVVAASLVGVLQVRPLRRVAGERLSRWLPSAQHAAATALRPTWGAGLSAFGLHLAARSVSALEIALAAYLLHAPLSVEAWALAAGALALTSAAFPWVPGQVGVQEAALTGALAATGLEPSTALAVSLLMRLRQLVFVPLGLALVFVRPAADADADGAAT